MHAARRFFACPSLLASMDELEAPCPEDSRGSASGLGSERSLIGRPAKPEADKQRSKSWRCTLEAPSEVQQSRLREAGMDRCTSKLHTVATLAEGRGCTSSLHVQRFAMDISSDAGTEFLRAFFVFSIPVRRGQLEQRITADARWTPASYAEWPEVARTFHELLHIGWSGTSRPILYEAHGLQLELVLGAHAPGRAAIT